jgi:spore coat polysaccharide biosynthesis protein SpsF
MNKKIDIIVEARMSSKRLPHKVMLKVMGRPLLDLMIERLKKINFVNDIIIATTTNKDDDEIVNLAKNNKILFFRGSENDVLKRVVLAAKKNKTDVIVQITGDSPLVDKKITENLINFFIENQDKYDFVSNDAGYYNREFKKTFSLGLSAKVFSSSLLYKIEKITDNKIDREHIVNYILKNNEKYRIHNYEADNKYFRPDLRFTLDYLEDYKVIKLIYENLYVKNIDFSATDIFNFLDKNPSIKKINSHCIQKEYKYS